jgi:hypothetical protein
MMCVLGRLLFLELLQPELCLDGLELELKDFLIVIVTVVVRYVHHVL